MIASTSILLLVLAPPPLTALVWKSMYALDVPESLDGIFETQTPVTAGRWRYIYVHHSQTPGGDAVGLSQQGGASDHFVIGNGDGCIDGEIQMTQIWNRQQSIAVPPRGAARMDPGSISICLVGDFDRTRPTPTQMRRLGQLVGALQEKLHIPAGGVQVFNLPATPAGIGRSFPLAMLRDEILP